MASNWTELDQADTKDQSQSKSSKIAWVIGKAEHTNCTLQLSDQDGEIKVEKAPTILEPEMSDHMSAQPDEPNKVIADRTHELIIPTKCNKTAAEEHVFCHESGELFAEDVDQHMAILPEVVTPEKEITIEDIQVGDPGVPLTNKQAELRDRIWKSRHLLMG